MKLDIDLKRLLQEHGTDLSRGQLAELKLEIHRLRRVQGGEETEIDRRQECIESLLVPLRTEAAFAVRRVAARELGRTGVD